MKLNKKKIYLNISLTLLGGILGFTYWRYVGCNSGACPIHTKWYLSTLYGAAIGLFISTFFVRSKTSEKKIEDND